MMNYTLTTETSACPETLTLSRAPRTMYRRGAAYAREVAGYAGALRDRRQEKHLSRKEKALVRAMREVVTERESECLELYYTRGLNYSQISQRLNINVSTISRNIQRGEHKLNRILDLARSLGVIPPLEPDDKDQARSKVPPT